MTLLRATAVVVLLLAPMTAPITAAGSWALGGAPTSRPLFAPDGDDDLADAELLAAVQEMVDRSHRFLAKHQNRDGSFSLARHQAGKHAPVAVTALASLSFMAGGHAADRGPYGTLLRRSIRWLVDHCDESGFFTDDDDTVSLMHGQGYALLALTQAYGTYGRVADRDAVRAAIVRAVRLVERTQSTVGGWYYQPVASGDHENSITVCMVQALRAARDAGFTVDVDVIRRAERYIARCQDESSGRFRYRLKDPKTSWALTAAALSTLNALGDYGSDVLDDGYAALTRSDPYIGVGRALDEFFIDYGALYAAQAYWQHRDQRMFARWWPRFVDACRERMARRDAGSFGNGTYGDVYATSMVSLTLQVPLGYLPVFQR